MLSVGIIYWSLTAGLIMKCVLAVVGCLALAGCVTPDAIVEPLTTPDGRAAHIAWCGGEFSDITYCYKAARETCGGNYEILTQRESPRLETRTENRRMEFICSKPV